MRRTAILFIPDLSYLCAVSLSALFVLIFRQSICIDRLNFECFPCCNAKIMFDHQIRKFLSIDQNNMMDICIILRLL